MRITVPIGLLLAWLLGCNLSRPVPDQDRDQIRALGKILFFDPRLSANGEMSCATCHQPRFAFTNGAAVARGVHGEMGERNVPTLINRAGTSRQFWDGRANSLEDQVTIVITAANEMGADLGVVLERLRRAADYPARFRRAFHEDGIDPRKIARALAAFERTLAAGESPYDRFLAGDAKALDDSQVRGKDLFFDKFKCVSCHSGPNFSDESMRTRCYPATNNLNEFVPIQIEKSKFLKTPTLRNLVYTAPYMHNGSLNTLEQVVDFYTPTFQAGADRLPDTRLPVVRISAAEKRDLVQFLKALSAPRPYQENGAF